MFPEALRKFFPGSGTNRAAEPFGVQRLGEEDPLFREQVKAFRAKLEYRAEALGQKVIAVTSAISGEGKTLLTGKLAMGLASSGRKKVLLIGLDLRKADLAQTLEIAPLPGLTEYLAGSAKLDEIIRTTVMPGLHVIPPGIQLSNPTDLLTGTRFREFLAASREKFDFVILDTPPLLPVADTLLLRDQIDAFLLIYRANWTPHDLFRQAIEELGESQILGVVLNGIEQQKQRYYDKYYGSYYRNTHIASAGTP